jgi:hypothetical protein
MKINKPEKLHNKHNEIYYYRRVLSKNNKYPTKYVEDKIIACLGASRFKKDKLFYECGGVKKVMELFGIMISRAIYNF